MRVHLSSFTMAYTIQGEGQPVLFIHGYPLGRSLWQSQLNHLSGLGQIIAPDLRGHGDSEAISGPYTMDQLAEDCAELLDHLGIVRPVVICGLSMGGYVTFAFYRRFYQRVRGLILVSTRAAADSSDGKANRDKSILMAQEKGAGMISKAMLPKMLSPKTAAGHPDLIAQVHRIMEQTSVPGIIGALSAMRDRPDSTSTLAKIDHPTLVVHGADDLLIPLSEAEAMTTAIRGARLQTIPDAGHLPNLEQPELFNQAVREFIRTL